MTPQGAERPFASWANYLADQHEARVTARDSLRLITDLAGERYLDRLPYYPAAVRALAREVGLSAGEERIRRVAASRLFRVPIRTLDADIARFRAAHPPGPPRLRLVGRRKGGTSMLTRGGMS